MKAVKERGRAELDALKRRVIRAYAMGRITAEDHSRLVGLINQLDTQIINMTELDNEGEEL